jgi:hypothetical protein
MYQHRYITHSNKNIWPSVDLGAGWIVLTPTGCNVNRTIDMQDVKLTGSSTRKISDFFKTCSEFGAL